MTILEFHVSLFMIILEDASKHVFVGKINNVKQEECRLPTFLYTYRVNENPEVNTNIININKHIFMSNISKIKYIHDNRDCVS